MVQAKDRFVSDMGRRSHPSLSCAKCGEPLPLDRKVTTLTCDLCGQGHQSLAPPPVTRPAEYRAGDGIAVLWGDHWWSAHIIELVGMDLYHIHYEGWGPRYDEVVDVRRIRPLDFVPGSTIIPPQIEPDFKVKRANMLSAVGIVLVVLVGVVFLLNWAFHDRLFNQQARTASVETADFGAITGRLPGLTLLPDVRIESGQSYYVHWGNGWYLGTVVTVADQNNVVIQYDGWGDYQNEMVTRDRLRVIP